jgi:hypothetical protein
MSKVLTTVVVLLMTAGCTLRREEASTNIVKHRFDKPPQAAGACFARNAEARSSALVAEVKPPDARGHVEVIVRVKNGVLYATVDLRPVGARAEGTITLMVISKRGTQELVSSLVESC